MFKRVIAVAMTVVMLATGIDMTAFAAVPKTTEAQEVSGTGSIGAPEVAGTNSVGTILAGALSEEQTEQAAGNGNSIMSVEMEGKTATVVFSTVKPATLVVGIFDDAGRKLLAAGTKEVTADSKEAKVIIDVDTMPDYYYVKAFLIESDTLKPVCKVYENPNYTKEMQEFFAKTTDDFAPDRVYNLDEDKTNNFVVYGTDVAVIAEQEGVNTPVSVDEENLKYVFENIDNNLRSLEAGDIIAYGETDPLIIKVDSILIDGNTATIAGASAEMQEVFDFVKIDTTCEIVVPEEPEEIETQSAGMIQGSKWGIEIDEGFTISKEHVEKDLDVELPGGATLEGNFKCKPSVIVKIYHHKYTYLEVLIGLESEVSVAVSKECEAEILIGEIPMAAAYGILITLPIFFVFEANGEVSVTYSMATKLGVSYHSDDGFSLVEPISEVKMEFKVEATIFVGLRASVQVSALKIISVEAAVTGGAEGVAAYSKTAGISSEKKTEKHACKNCVDGDVKVKFIVSGIVRVFNKIPEGGKVDFAELSFKVGDFYYSFDNIKFGWGECPNKEYLVLIQFVDRDGNNVAGVFVDSELVSDSNGNIKAFIKPGSYNFVAQKDGYQDIPFTLDITDEAVKKIVNMDGVSVKEDDYIGDGDNGDNEKPGEEEGTGDGGDHNLQIRKNNRLEMGSLFGGAIAEDGSLYMWGFNGNGQVGNGTTTDCYEPVKVLDNVVAISTASHHSGAITEDGSLYMWGANSFGRLGNGTTTDCLEPVKVLDHVVTISLGSSYSGAITEDGSLYMWGYNGYGQVGNGTTKNCLEPVKVLDNVVAISTGESHSGAITEDGSLYMWGYNREGEVGNGTTKNCLEPVKVLDNVVAISTGGNHSGAITKDGSLYMWGRNYDGQVGNGTTTNCLEPVKVLDNVTEICLGGFHSGAITEDGGLYMWGRSNYGQVGNGTTTNCLEPVKVLDNVIEISLVYVNSGAITKDGSLYMWGYNRAGEVGNGTKKDCSEPVKVLDNVIDISTGANYNGAITEDGSLYMWGYNEYGQVGNGTTTNCLVPTKISLGENTTQTVNMTSREIPIASLPLYASVMAVTDGNDSTTDGDDVSTATFPGKLPGETYNFYVMKTRTGNGDATADNILYMDQVVADSEGTVKVTYIPREECAEAKIFLSGRLGKYSLANAVVTAKDQLYTGEELPADVQVTYNGKQLTEGVDYDICGDYSATEVGEYTLVIRGTGEYEGEQRVTYHIRRYSLDVFDVTFDSNGGTAVEPQEIEKGQKAVEPENPVRENHHFKGWYYNNQLFDFDTPVTGHIKLVARWEEYSKLPVPAASVPSGSRVNAGREVKLQSEEGAVIYYTLDGTLPDKESTVYTKPIPVETDMTIKAYAEAEGWYDSDVATYNYTVVKDGDSFGTVEPEDVPTNGIPEGIWVGKIADQTYTGKAIKPEVRVYDGTRRLVAGRDYSISYKNNVSAQTDLKVKNAPTVIIKGKGNYTKSITAAFKILPIDINEDTVVADDLVLSYNKKVQKKSPAVYYGGKKLSGKDVMVAFTDQSAGAYQNPGTYQVKLKGQGNFTGERVVKLIVTDKTPMSSVKVDKIAVQTYQNGVEIKPLLKVSFKKDTLKEGKDYSVTYSNNREIGTATVLLTGMGKYVGVKRLTFKIAGKDMKKVKVDGLSNRQYTGEAIVQNLTITYAGATLSDKEYSVEYSNNVNVGTATVTITGKGAFFGQVKKTFKITAYDLKTDSEKAVSEIAQNFEVLYTKGGSEPKPDVIYKGRVLTAGRDYTIRYKNNAEVTTGETKKYPTYIIQGKGNFTGTLEGTFRIVAKELNHEKEPVSISVDDIAYIGKAGKYVSTPVLTDSNGKKLQAGKDYDRNIQYALKDGTILDKTSAVAAGSEIVVTVTGAGNYSGTLRASYRVAESDFKKVNVTVKEQEYTGEAITLDAQDLQVKLGETVLTYGKDYEIVEGSYRNAIRKGTASVKIKGMNGYGGSKTVMFKITARELK